MWSAGTAGRGEGAGAVERGATAGDTGAGRFGASGAEDRDGDRDGKGEGEAEATKEKTGIAGG